MKKLAIRFLIPWALVLAITVILALILPFARTASYWVAFGCTLAMFALILAAARHAFGRGRDLFSKILGWPIFKACWALLIAQLIAGFALMAAAGLLQAVWAVLIELVLFALAAAVLAARDSAREIVTESEGRVSDRTAAWKALRLRIGAVAEETGNPEVKKLAEEIRYADPTPTELDGRLAEMVETLSGYATQENIRKAFQLLRQRSELAKAAKKS